MKRYRKKPIVIEASDPITRENIIEIAEWCNGAVRNPTLGLPWITVSTLEGDHIADHGDRIIRGIKGEFYPCKPDIFDATYEAVD